MGMKYVKLTSIFVVLTLGLFSLPVKAIEPPRPGEMEGLDSEEIIKRVEFAQSLGNHEFDSDLVQRSIIKLRHLTEPDLYPAPPPAWKGMPTTGNVKVLALLIEFQDYLHANNATGTPSIDNRLFGSGNPGDVPPYESLANYYDRSSYGQLDLNCGTTLGWYQTAYPRSAVPQTAAGRENLIMEVLNHWDATGHDFTQYDNDNDGVIDYFIVIWTGPDNGWGNFWWGYQTRFNVNPSYALDGKSFFRTKYSWQWESLPPGGAFSPLVVIHETGHALGLPDYYDYDSTIGPDGGVGNLDMMDANTGDHNAFSKWMLDWITPTFIGSGSKTLTLQPSGTTQDAVMIIPGADSSQLFSEYFMVQNRHKTGNDNQWFPTGADGMLIWHVDATLDITGTNFQYNNSFTDHKLLRLMEADGLEEIETGNQTADAGDYYVPGKTFGPSSSPDSQKYDGSDSMVCVKNFTITGESMSALFSVEDCTAPCGDLNGDAVVDNKDFHLFTGLYGSCGGCEPYFNLADFDNDGCITLVDYSAWYDCYINYTNP